MWTRQDESVGEAWSGDPVARLRLGLTATQMIAVIAAPVGVVILLVGWIAGIPELWPWGVNGLALSFAAWWSLRRGIYRPDWLLVLMAVFVVIAAIVGDPAPVPGAVAAIGSAHATLVVIFNKRGDWRGLVAMWALLSMALLVLDASLGTIAGLFALLAAQVQIFWASGLFQSEYDLLTNRFRAVVDESDAAILMIRAPAEGATRSGFEPIVYANDAARAMFGERIIGDGVDRVLPSSEALGPFDRRFATDQHGRRVPVSARWSSFSADREVFDVLELTDLSEEVEALTRLRVSEERYRELFGRVPVGLYTTTVDGVIVQGNEALVDMLGFASLGEMIGTSVARLYVDAGDRDTHIATMLRTGSATAEYQLRNEQGEVLRVRDHCSVEFGADGEPAFFHGELSDVTVEWAMTEELRRMLEAREQLIGAVSHELRTPLTSVLGLVRLLDAGELKEDEIEEIIHLVVSQTEDLHYIVEDLLAATRLTQGALSSSVTSFEALAQVLSVLETVDLADKEVANEVQPRLKMLGDAQRTRQILRNLLSNAAKYGGDTIRISSVEQDGEVAISVIDNGGGLELGKEAEAFEPFQRLHPQSTDHGSLGLGLHLSRGLAEAMGGRLIYRRHDDEWTDFTLILPVP